MTNTELLETLNHKTRSRLLSVISKHCNCPISTAKQVLTGTKSAIYKFMPVDQFRFEIEDIMAGHDIPHLLK